MLKVYLSTNGCLEGQLSSTMVERFFRKNRSTITNDPTQADLIVFYACGLTKTREKDSLLMIRKLQASMKTAGRLIVWGCLPKINPQSLKAVYDGPLIGHKDVSFFEEILPRATFSFDDIKYACAYSLLVPREGFDLGDPHFARDALTDAFILLKQSWDRLLARARSHTTFVIRIATGCTGRCTYCSERPVYGRIKSRTIDKIVSEFKWGLQQGYNRFSLAATDSGCYGKDLGCTLSDLLTKIIEVDDRRDYKIILNQVNPLYLKEMLSDLEHIFASGKIERLNSPVQCGSNRVLRLMGRPYTAEEWRECMLRINRQFPKIRLSTQFMVGFPSENDEDFTATLKLLDYPLFLDEMVVFKFSTRPTAYASCLPEQVSEKTKELRARKLLRKYLRNYPFNMANRYAISFLEAPYDLITRRFEQT